MFGTDSINWELNWKKSRTTATSTSSIMLRPRLLRAALPRFSVPQYRSLHAVPQLGKDFTEGIDGLLTKDGFRIAYTEYQTLMLAKLDALTAGSATDNSLTPHQLLIKYARQPTMASLFNHASQAFNNHFFFDCLSNETVPIPALLKSHIDTNFGSVETLKKEFVAIGNSMFGPGYVWLVKKDDGQYSLLNTYIAGSPWPKAHWRRQSRDMNTEAYDAKTPADHVRREALLNSDPVNSVGAFGAYSAKSKLAPGAVGLKPILCVSTWQHVYLADWGILQKKEYLEAWWDHIDWEKVAGYAKTESQLMVG